MRRLEGIVASAMDGIITVNDRQEIVLFNPAAERMFGIVAEEALGQHISRFIPERFRQAHAAHIHRFAETGVTSRQMGALGAISGLRTDGEEFPIEASISQVEVGGERLSTVILRDITERKAAEEALVESRRRMEGIVESAMDALVTIDEQQRIILFNPAAERMFGVEAAEVIGAPLERFIPERFRAGHAEHIRHFKEAGVTNRRMGALGAISGLRASGEEFPVEASISYIEVGGARLGTVILRDITERRANEEARLLLAREVDHRAKNALAVVQSVLALTRATTKEEFVAAVRGRVSSLGRAHSLLAQNRWEGADLARVVTDETAAYQGSGQVFISGQTVLLPPSAVQPISLLIHELATNAVKYGALSRDTGRVDVSWTILSDGQLRLEWREHGGPPVLSEPANQGFGSTLIRELVRRQLQGIADQSWASSGMTLVLTLPPTAYRAEGPPVGATAADSGERGAAPRRAGRLLVVEDEALIALALARDLDAMGWEIVGPAGSLDEAMNLLERVGLPDAAVLDINLGGKLVYPVADRLRAHQVPFVFCSGYEQLEADSQFESCPRLRKPVDVQLLDTTLRRVRAA
ncbi:PAS domain S-box protein [Phenylobacterium sp.]|uniref:PAS domain S-box protein n=1 Tax=Phenylobacterium sp. TaxID=1871053 RepID=UPI002EDAB9C7